MSPDVESGDGDALYVGERVGVPAIRFRDISMVLSSFTRSGRRPTLDVRVLDEDEEDEK